MPDLKDHAETIGATWDSLSTGGKLRLLVFAFGLLAATGGIGFWFATQRNASTVAALEAKHERDLTHQDDQRLEQIKDLRRQLSRHLWAKESGSPDFENAEPLQTSQKSFLAEYFKNRNPDKDDRTTVALADFFRKYQGRAVHWEGFVWDVSDEGHLTCVTMAFPQYDNPQTLLVDCYFAKDLVLSCEHLRRGDYMLVYGVLNGRGELVKCGLAAEGSGVPSSHLKVTAPRDMSVIPKLPVPKFPAAKP